MRILKNELVDSGERMIPPEENEISFVFARHKFAYQYASKFVKNKYVLDVGCGTGYGCSIMSETAQYVCGVDYDISALSHCVRRYKNPKNNFVQMIATRLAFRRRFDVAVSFQVIEHIENSSKYIEQLKFVTKRGGLILISTPNVKQNIKTTNRNPFHAKEFDYNSFNELIMQNFSSYEIIGISYSKQNFFRSVFQSLPLYRLGKILKRKSKIKKLAGKILNLTGFTITRTNVESSLDVLAYCKNL